MVDLELEERHKRRNASPDNPRLGMTIIVKTVTKLTVSLILLFGIYIALHGSTSHGGGFAGGVIIALAFIHIVLAFGREDALKIFPMITAYAVLSVSALLFLTIGCIGYLRGGFMFNFLAPDASGKLLSGGVVPLYNILLCICIGAAIFAVFLAMVGYSKEKE